MTDVDQSFWETRDSDPFPYYEARLAGDREVIWDERLNAWLAFSYKASREILIGGDQKFGAVKADLLPPGKFMELQGGPRMINFLLGDEHKRMHRWWAAQFNQHRLKEIHERIILPVVTESLAALAGADTAELVADLTSTLPIKIIFGLLGVPATPDQVAAAVSVFDRRKGYVNALLADPLNSSLEDAVASTEVAMRMFDPYIEARRDGTGDDFISALWRDGPDILSDWTIQDVRTQCMTAFSGAGDTLTGSTNNLLYYLATHPALMAQLHDADDTVFAAVIEESLRLYGPPHARDRKAMVDLELRGVEIQAGEAILGITGAAGRDEEHYSCPYTFDVTRSRPQDHLTFGAGSRACVGAPLARAILQTLLPMVVGQWPDLRLDPSMEPPSYTGFLLRSFQPLHVRLDPKPATL